MKKKFVDFVNKILGKFLSEKKIEMFWEIFRFGLVGFTAFLVNMGVMLLVERIILSQPAKNPNEIAFIFSTTIAFICSVIVNYLLSIHFVFVSEKQKTKGRDAKGRTLFLLTAVVGMFLNTLISAIFVKIGFSDIIGIVFATVFVMIWNYTSRKILIFK